MPIAYKDLIIVGTSHIARQSINEVKEEIAKKPALVAIELDSNRLKAMSDKAKTSFRFKDIWKIGISGLVFAVLGAWAQKKLGRLVGVAPGTEMLTAVNLAKKNNIDISLIDQDITITLAKLSRSITWKEKLRFPYDILKTILFRKSELKRLGIGELDLSKVPPKEIIKALTEELKKKYPNVYKVLVEERNTYMAKRLFALSVKSSGKTIVAVVGAGHEEEILEIFKKIEKEAKVTYEFSVGN